MKECPLKLIAGIYKCSDMGKNNCLFMLNESIRDGDLSLLHNFFSKSSDRYLTMWAKSKKSGRIRESCLRYNEIRKVAAQVLKERKTK